MTGYKLDPNLKSFIALDTEKNFPIHNLPYGVARNKNASSSDVREVVVAIGERALRLRVLEDKGLLGLPAPYFQGEGLNPLMEAGSSVWKKLRKRLIELLSASNPLLREDSSLQEAVFWKRQDLEMVLPARVGDYTDFYASKEHASHVGAMFRSAENPLLPNWVHIPIAYHGRASSLVAGDHNLRRPVGQLQPILPGEGEPQPVLAPTKRLDFELELAFFVGGENSLGSPIRISDAKDRIFGCVLLNDWSARDIQKWEYQPLGPFTSKSFTTAISPWIVPMEALDPFLVKGPQQNPQPLSYLRADWAGHLDLEMTVDLKAEGKDPTTICRTNSRYLYWSMEQQLTHHSVTGCNMRAGDLLASWTISGSEKGSYGSMLELSWGGKNPIALGCGQERSFLCDGDTVTFKASCAREGVRIGFGSLSGTVLPALQPSWWEVSQGG